MRNLPYLYLVELRRKKLLFSCTYLVRSRLFGTIKHTHPLIFMRRVKSENLLAIIDLLYLGEANVCQESLDSFLAIADELQLIGLVGKASEVDVDQKHTPPKTKSEFNTDVNISKHKRTIHSNLI